MKYFIPGSENLYIDKDLVITKGPKESCDLSLEEIEGETFVWITLYGLRLKKPLVWVYGIAFCGVTNPVRQNDVTFTKYVQKTTGFEYFPKQKVIWWYDVKKRFRISARYPSIAVDKFGNVIHVETGILIKPRSRDVKAPLKKRRTVWIPAAKKEVSVARLVGFAWVDNADPVYKTDINHKDGNPENDSSSNLEWVTPKENIKHAFETGLRSDCLGCTLRNFETGEILTFSSLCSVVKFLGRTSTGSYNGLMSSRKNRLLNGLFEIRVNGDETPWVYANADTEYKGSLSGSRYIITLLYKGKTLVYCGLSQLVKDFKLWNMHEFGGASSQSILNRLLKENPEVKLLKFVDQSPIRPVQVLDISTQRCTEYPTVTATAEALELSQSVVSGACKKSGSTVHLSRYRIRFLPKNPKEAWVEIKPHRTERQEVRITNVKTLETSTCRSLREVSLRFNIHRPVLKSFIDTGHLYKDLKFETTIKD